MKLTITFPSNSQLTRINDYCFYNCNNLIFVNIPQSIEYIGTFRSCTKLSSLIIPSGSGAFRDCIAVSRIESENTNFAIATGALFDKTRTSLILFPSASTVKYFLFPSDTRTINEGAFMSCRNIIFSISTNSITKISRNAFEDCTNLRCINIPLSVFYIGGDAFLGCHMISCGIEIEIKTKEFRDNLIKSCKLDSIALKERRGLVTQNCFPVYNTGRILFLAVMIVIFT